MHVRKCSGILKNTHGPLIHIAFLYMTVGLFHFLDGGQIETYIFTNVISVTMCIFTLGIILSFVLTILIILALSKFLSSNNKQYVNYPYQYPQQPYYQYPQYQQQPQQPYINCPNCKLQFKNGTLFCSNCGTKIIT